MFEYLEVLDQQLFLALNAWRTDALDLPMYYLTKAGTWTPVFALLLWLFYRKTKSIKAVGLGLLAMLLCVGLGDLTSTRLFKQQIKRYRPTHHLEIGPQVHTVVKPNGEEYRGGRYSFVSSHATNFFAMATMAFLLLGRKRRHWWLFAWAALVSYTRLYLGVHYPSDLLAGALLGCIIAFGLHHLALKVPSFRSHYA